MKTMYDNHAIIDAVLAQAIGRESLQYFKSTHMLDQLVRHMQLDAHRAYPNRQARHSPPDEKQGLDILLQIKYNVYTTF